MALEEGSLTAHVTILARAMGIPVLGRVRGLRDAVAEGDPLLLDSSAGALFVRPAQAVLSSFEERTALRLAKQAEFEQLKDLPATSIDGVRVQLMMNAGLRSDLPALDAYRHSSAHDAMMVDLKPFVDHIVVLDSPLDAGLPA